MSTNTLYSLPSGAISGGDVLINNYSEFTSNQSYTITATGGTITLPKYFVGFKDKSTGLFDGNQDKGTIEYEVTGLGSAATTVSWISNVTFAKYDTTANKITFTASENTTTSDRVCRIKLKNSESSYYISITQSGKSGISLGGSTDEIVIKFQNGNGYLFTVTSGSDIQIDGATPIFNDTTYSCYSSYSYKITGSGTFRIKINTSNGSLDVKSITYEVDSVVSQIFTGNSCTLNIDELKGKTVTVILSTSL